MRRNDQAPAIGFGLRTIAAAIRNGDVTAEVVARDVLARCTEFAHLRAFISQDAERVLEAARDADGARAADRPMGPLHGVPVLVKDNIDVRGYATTAGTPGLAGVEPREDAPVVRRLLEAGALVAGKANLHELAVGGTSQNRHYGAVVNPWRPELVAGGSSGGSAVAVAARLVPAALGTDTNGSVRGPCSFEGIAGFRPSAGRYPYGGTFPSTPTRDAIGTLATAVEDLALLDEVLADERTPLEDIDLRGLRIGRPAGQFTEGADAGTLAVLEDAIALLRDHGALIVEADLPGLHALAARAAWPISAYETWREVGVFLEGRTRRVTIGEIVDRIASPVVRERFNPPAMDGARLEAAWRVAMDVHRPRLQQQLAAHFAAHRLDALLYPTTPFPAVAVDDDTAALVVNGRKLPQGYGDLIRNTVYQSAAGIPSLTVPAGVTADGLPVGLGLDGPQGSDRRLLAIGRAFERVRGPFPRPGRAASDEVRSRR